MPWSEHSQNLAPSTIQGPASLDKESLLCGPASSGLISSQRTSTREASAACLAPLYARVVSGVGPEQDRARRITSRARQNSRGMRPPGTNTAGRSGDPPGSVHERLSRGDCITRTLTFTCQRRRNSSNGARWLDASNGIRAESICPTAYAADFDIRRRNGSLFPRPDDCLRDTASLEPHALEGHCLRLIRRSWKNGRVCSPSLVRAGSVMC